MAKQSGIHQIRGKVGEHSYYRQTGVSSGLIRSINQGMSQRVKTSDEYANTRLSNSEFGGACNVAGLLGRMVEPKFRPMILPFSQSNMAKAVLEIARRSELPLGRRVVGPLDTAELADVLSSQSKRQPSDFVNLSVARTEGTSFIFTSSYTSAQASLMLSLGITQLDVLITQIDLATGKFDSITGKIQSGYIRKRSSSTATFDLVTTPGGDSDESDFTVVPFSPTPNLLYNGHQLFVAVVLPAREIGGQDFVWQQYCCFQAFSVPS